MKPSIQKIIRVIESEIRGAKGQELADLNDVLQGVIDMLGLKRCEGCQEIGDSDKCNSCAQDEDDLQATEWYLNGWLNNQRL